MNSEGKRHGELTALSRKSCCSFKSGFLLLVLGALSRDSGFGSEDGEAEEVVIEARCVPLDDRKLKLGRRKSGAGLHRCTAGLYSDHKLAAAFIMDFMSLQWSIHDTLCPIGSSAEA